jgi:hypothetical protein
MITSTSSDDTLQTPSSIPLPSQTVLPHLQSTQQAQQSRLMKKHYKNAMDVSRQLGRRHYLHWRLHATNPLPVPMFRKRMTSSPILLATRDTVNLVPSRWPTDYALYLELDSDLNPDTMETIYIKALTHLGTIMYAFQHGERMASVCRRLRISCL